MLPLGGRRIRIQLLVAVMLQTTLSRLRRQLPPAGTNRDTWQSGGVGRVTGRLFGAAMTVGTVGQDSAPGQIAINKLREVMDILS